MQARSELKERIGAAIDAIIDVQKLLPSTGYSMSIQQLQISVEAHAAYKSMLHALKVTNEGID